MGRGEEERGREVRRMREEEKKKAKGDRERGKSSAVFSPESI